VKEFTLEALVENEWKQIDDQTTIGKKRILRFPNVTASQLRLNIIDSKASPVISNIGVYKAQKVLVEPQIRRNKNEEVTITGFDSGLDIYYSIDGSEPSAQSLKYTEPFLLNEKATVKAIVVDSGTKTSSQVSTAQFDVSKLNWKLTGSFELIDQSHFIFDGNPESAWSLNNKPPIDFIIDLAETLNIAGFTYLPDQGRWNPGIINWFEFYVSSDGRNWGKPVSEGEFANIKNSPVLQKKEFNAVKGRFVKFRALSPVNENGRVGIAEFDIITQ
jgi:alpha-L-fucosidase